MVSAMLIALVLQGASGSPVAEVQDEIVVLGKKMKAWKARLVTRHDTETGLTTTRCTTLKSSADAEIDAIGCAAMRTCLAQFRPRLLVTADRKRPASERKAMSKAAYKDVGVCVASEREKLIAALADRRFYARQGIANASN